MKENCKWHYNMRSERIFDRHVDDFAGGQNNYTCNLKFFLVSCQWGKLCRNSLITQK